ncbi:DNA-directed RNA polymerases I and III subunit RPAC1 [Smittium culicis]|uniref:DNA-directed RNA polymerases I and III subunit RPAC1 n=1 Tax=Smittium culicis TaxID=133412 RepID=A0A1R1X1W1_9FUNG|nr:DNA-directed RNA polymerases I and III subunit RPAC1 [Smittium culicis]OMJ22097.1 DNA-directed RNA polymerases I and III subunit RPAC1 [Smittium culicis]
MSKSTNVKILKDQVLDVSTTDIPFTEFDSTSEFKIDELINIPTMAIEKVYMLNNTGVIQDEVLSQRFGLVPIKADPREFSWKEDNEDPTDQNTIVFKLNIGCKFNPDASKDEKDPKVKYINSSVYSSHLKWDPKGDQAERFASSPIKPVHDDILLAKLRPGQEIVCELHCQKGIGRDHAKFSPVATASYRLLPDIIITKEISGDDAYKFQKCFPEGVVDVVNENGKMVAKVVNPRKDTVSREVLRHEEFDGKVKLERVRDHFIFNIESTGAISPPELLHMAIEILASKCQTLKHSISSLLEKK